MATIEKALQIAAQAHEGRTDKNGLPYIMHPLRVLNAVEGLGEDVAIAAILHDVIEDSSVTIEDLRRAGFSGPILASLECLTHLAGEPYAEYVIRCGSDETARRVKLADLEDNARPSRALLRPDRIEPDMARLRKYFLSYKFLTGFLTREQYLGAMGAGGVGDGKGKGKGSG
jgi:(p)ppGpp synthase/HD superfamily hydrolase